MSRRESGGALVEGAGARKANEVRAAVGVAEGEGVGVGVDVKPLRARSAEVNWRAEVARAAVAAHASSQVRGLERRRERERHDAPLVPVVAFLAVGGLAPSSSWSMPTPSS